MNPHETPASAMDVDESGQVRVIRERSPQSILAAMVGAFAFIGYRTYNHPREINARLAPVWILLLVLVVVGTWAYLRIRESQLRSARPGYGGRRALWVGTARRYVNLIFARPGYLFLTVDSLVWIRHLEDGEARALAIPLDDISEVRVTSGARLTLWQSGGEKTRLLTGGAKQWEQVIAMARDVRHQRRSRSMEV